MLVVMGIIGILVVLLLANYRGREKQYELNNAARQLVSNLRKAQNMAMSGSGGYRGYGIYASGNSFSYIIFGDKNDNQRYDGGDDILEAIQMPSKTKILSVSPSSGGGLSVNFRPPAPTTYINGQSTAGLSAAFILQTTDASLSKTVTATTAGLIQ
jgi:type II secretory pathway pseudopilin PulG